ncbi:MAG TPA: PDZ domain-containing protein, partial [Candidatus Cloacimonadota bacterium]|nr:PDZ domain-containing protein [Candidatus Cloacimonadota bacterium]
MFAQNIYIGIYVNDIDMSTNIKYNIKGGVRIDSVLENSPASKAGLKKDHIIWKIDNQLVTNEEEFQKA